MAKKFNIHNWQAKQRKKRLDEVQIKKVVDQSMSNNHIGKLMDVIRNNDLGKTLNTIAVIVDQTGGMPDGAAQMIADLVPKIMPEKELDEHHAGDYNPGFLKQSVNTFLDKLKIKTKEGKDYKIVEKIITSYYKPEERKE